MEEDKKHELSVAYTRMMAHNLWRKGKIDEEPVKPHDIGDALETACGALLEYMTCSMRMEVAESSLRSLESAHQNMEKEFETQTAISKDLLDRLNQSRAEVRRLKSILAGHHISYKKRSNK